MYLCFRSALYIKANSENDLPGSPLCKKGGVRGVNTTCNDNPKEGLVMDISILKYLDVLIGFAIVMALASVFVTALTHIIISRTIDRAEILQQGIAILLKRADPKLGENADKVAEAVLQWQPTSGDENDKRNVIVREQLVRILLEIAAPDATKLDAAAKSAIQQSLFPNRFAAAAVEPVAPANAPVAVVDGLDAAKLLEIIDRESCKLEAEHPDLAGHIVHTKAIVKANAGKFINAVMIGFDTMSENMTAHFAAKARLVTFFIALGVALLLPLDTLELLERLSTDDKLRTALVTEAIEKSASYEKSAQSAPSTDKTNKATPAVAKTTQPAPSTDTPNKTSPAVWNPETHSVDFNAVKNAYADLNDPKLGLASHGGWPNIFNSFKLQAPKSDALGNQAKAPEIKGFFGFLFSHEFWDTIISPRFSCFMLSFQFWSILPGCFLSALLMTMGAPFWFDALKNLLKLRSSLSRTDDEAREKRRTDQSTA